MKERKLVLTLEIFTNSPLKNFKKIRQAAFTSLPSTEPYDSTSYITVDVNQSQVNVIKE